MILFACFVSRPGKHCCLLCVALFALLCSSAEKVHCGSDYRTDEGATLFPPRTPTHHPPAQTHTTQHTPARNTHLPPRPRLMTRRCSSCASGWNDSITHCRGLVGAPRSVHLELCSVSLGVLTVDWTLQLWTISGVHPFCLISRHLSYQSTMDHQWSAAFLFDISLSILPINLAAAAYTSFLLLTVVFLFLFCFFP